jgi:peptidoglycan/LPS O-acetylase OafA/YrhL
MGGTLILLVVVWLLSALLTYWGARRAVSRILLAFGSFWLVFTGLSHATEPVAVLLEARLAAPFFVLAWTARRWPRSTGALLVLVALYVFFAFDLYQSFTTRMDAWPVLLTTFLPLTACGLALLGAGRANAREEAGSRAPESTHLGERSARLEKRGD